MSKYILELQDKQIEFSRLFWNKFIMIKQIPQKKKKNELQQIARQMRMVCRGIDGSYKVSGNIYLKKYELNGRVTDLESGEEIQKPYRKLMKQFREIKPVKYRREYDWIYKKTGTPECRRKEVLLKNHSEKVLTVPKKCLSKERREYLDVKFLVPDI